MLTIVICLVVVGVACYAVLRITLEDENQPATAPGRRHGAPAPAGEGRAAPRLDDAPSPFGATALPDVDETIVAGAPWLHELDGDGAASEPEPTGGVGVGARTTTTLERRPHTTVTAPVPAVTADEETTVVEPVEAPRPAEGEVPERFREHPAARRPRTVAAPTNGTAPPTMFDPPAPETVVLTPPIDGRRRLRSSAALVVTLALVGTLLALAVVGALAVLVMGVRSAIGA